MYAFIKTCQMVHLRFVPFTVCKFYHTHTHTHSLKNRQAEVFRGKVC